MREIDMGNGVVRVTVELVYTRGDYKDIIPRADSALLDVGIVAFKALVSSVASHAAEAVISGAGAGALAGGVAARESGQGRGRAAVAVLAGALIGAAVGAAGDKLAESREPYCVATKQSGRWHIKRVPKS